MSFTRSMYSKVKCRPRIPLSIAARRMVVAIFDKLYDLRDMRTVRIVRVPIAAACSVDFCKAEHPICQPERNGHAYDVRASVYSSQGFVICVDPQCNKKIMSARRGSRLRLSIWDGSEDYIHHLAHCQAFTALLISSIFGLLT